MIWHIFRKDWRLLWPIALGVALLNLLQRIVLSHLSVFRYDRLDVFQRFSEALGYLSLFGIAVLIVIAVQQDTLPGLSQDWLVRPIRRRDLLFSKILFVVLTVQAPIFLIEVGKCLAAGFSLPESVGAPLSRSIWMLLAFDLPAIAFATLTRNLMEAITGALVLTLVVAVFLTTTLAPGDFRTYALSWVTDSAQLVVGFIGAGLVVWLQYRARKTGRARSVFGAVAATWLFAQLLPWQAAFGIQEMVSRKPAAADAVQITFNPSAGRFRPQRSATIVGNGSAVFLPLKVAGGSFSGRRTADVAARIVTGDGHVISLSAQDPFRPDTGDETYQVLTVSDAVFSRLKDEHARLELHYLITPLGIAGKPSMPALATNQFVPGVGRCSTRVNPEGTEFELGCRNPGIRSCYAWFIDSWENNACLPDYSPWFGTVAGDSISRTGSVRTLVDRMNPAQPNDARIRFLVYKPETHFTREVVIPDIRLGDWTPDQT